MIALGSDHAGYALKCEVMEWLKSNGIPFHDYGCFSGESCNYAAIAQTVCNEVAAGRHDKALLFCGTGIGISIAANKVNGIRAAACSDYFSAKMTRLHNDANVLCLGGRVVAGGLACELVNVFLHTAFEGGRHQSRIDYLREIEKAQTQQHAE